MEYLLYTKSWVNGNNTDIRGNSLMYNDKGHSCCLGQWAHQAGVQRRHLDLSATPAEVAEKCSSVYDPAFVREEWGAFYLVPLSLRCMDINDDETTLESEKIEKLRALLEEHGHTLRLIGD